MNILLSKSTKRPTDLVEHGRCLVIETHNDSPINGTVNSKTKHKYVLHR